MIVKVLNLQTNSVRNYQYSELRDGTDESWSISNGTHKLIIKNTGSEMYNLANDPYENINLLNGVLSATEQSEKTILEAELKKIRQ